MFRKPTEAQAEAALDKHVAECHTCVRDGDGWLQYGAMCLKGQRIVQQLLDAD
jgi:hypothetical protein